MSTIARERNVERSFESYAIPVPEWFERRLSMLVEEFDINISLVPRESDGHTGQALVTEVMINRHYGHQPWVSLLLKIATSPTGKITDTEFESAFYALDQTGPGPDRKIAGTYRSNGQLYVEFQGIWSSYQGFLEEVFMTLYQLLKQRAKGLLLIRTWYSGCEAVPKRVEALG